MKNLKFWSHLNLSVTLTGFLFLSTATARADIASGGDHTLTRTLIGCTGVNQVTSADYSSAYAVGEDISGSESTFGDWDELNGYFGGRFGNTSSLKLLSAQIGSTRILQDGYQVGVPLDAGITLVFSDLLDPASIPTNILVYLDTDHLGQPQNVIEPTSFHYDITGSTVTLTPQSSWQGNTLYEVAVQPGLQNIDDFSLESAVHVPFITVLDPRQDNNVLHPLAGSASAGVATNNSLPAMNVHVPSDALSDYSTLLFSQDPLNKPLQVDPAILQTANEKAQATGGPYRTPLAISEICAYNLQGVPINSLHKPVYFSINTNNMDSTIPPLVRSRTLALWALDTEHQLWVKIPASQAEGTHVTAPITRFSVFALMGSADGSAVDVYVFPTPWRPHGPNTGTGSGQTGTEAAGLTFANLPSECAIRIYTLSGELVRQIHHSDVTGSMGREKWDGNTTGGGHAASGVYLWRVESSTDGKTGKLMIIR
ncbi:MAG: Ig-like domain-containing protein [Elusimicrobiota bacterium]|jgi:hypothetical protein